MSSSAVVCRGRVFFYFFPFFSFYSSSSSFAIFYNRMDKKVCSYVSTYLVTYVSERSTHLDTSLLCTRTLSI